MNVSIYDERDSQLWARVWRVPSGYIEASKGEAPIRIRSEGGLRAFLCGIEHTLEIDAFIVVVHKGDKAPDEYKPEKFNETVVTVEHVDPGTQYPGMPSCDAAHLCVERISWYAWRLLH